MSTEATTVTRSPRSGRVHQQPSSVTQPGDVAEAAEQITAEAAPEPEQAEQPPQAEPAKAAKEPKPKAEPKSKFPNAEVEAIAEKLLMQVDTAFKQLGPMTAENVSSFDALRIALNHNAGQYYLAAKQFPKP